MRRAAGEWRKAERRERDGRGGAVAGVSLVRGRVDGVRIDGSTPILSAGGIEIGMGDVLQVKGV